MVLKVPRHHSRWPFRLCVRDGSTSSDRATLVLHIPLHWLTDLCRLLGQREVVEVSSEV
jgi:hypothetical protein